MTKEEFKDYVYHLRTMNNLKIISDSTYQSLSQEAYQTLKDDEKLDGYCDYHILRSVIGLKNRFYESYWATSPEIAQDGPTASPNFSNGTPPEIAPKPISDEPTHFTGKCLGHITLDENKKLVIERNPFYFEINGITLGFDLETNSYISSNPIQLYYHSKELRPLTRSQYAAKVRWARLRKLNRKLEDAKLARTELMFQGVF